MSTLSKAVSTSVDRLQDQQRGEFALRLKGLPGIVSQPQAAERAMIEGGVRSGVKIIGAPAATSRTKNPQFHPNHTRKDFYMPGIGKLSRGFIRKNKIDGEPASKPITLSFFWNPSAINFAYAFNNSVLPESQQPEEQLGIPNLVSGASFSLSLFFDRTFEVQDGSLPDGCLVDMDIFDKLAGIDVGGSIMSDAVTIRLGPRWKFYAYMTQAEIAYQHFSRKMVPLRCTLNVGFVSLYRSENPLGQQTQAFSSPTNATPTGAAVATTTGAPGDNP